MRDMMQVFAQDKADASQMAYTISAPLHHTVGTPQCKVPVNCALCSNASRLAVQHYRPLLERRFVDQVRRLFGVECNITHIGGD